MNFRLTAILFGAILVVGVVLLILSFSGDGETVSTDALAEELASVKPEQIDTVEIEREGGAKLKLVRAGKDHWDEEWDVTTPGGKQHLTARADAGAVNELIASLLRAKPTAHPELSTNPAVHGLQPPGLKVTLRQGSERSSTINFGDVTSGGKAVAFVTTSARPNRPLATPRSSVEPLFRDPGRGKAVDLAKWAGDFRAKNVFANASSIDLVSAIALGTKDKTLALTRAGSGWVFTSPSGWGAADSIGDPAKPLSGVNPLINTLTNLRAASAADFVEAPTPKELTDYGLNAGNADAVRVEITNRDNEKLVAFIGKADTTAPATPPAPGMPPTPSDKVWVRVEGQPGVIRAAGRDLAGLRGLIENPDPLRDRTLLALEKPHIDGLDLSTGARLRKVGGEWKLFGPPTPTEPQATNPDAVNRLLDALTQRRTIRSFPAANDANFAPGTTQVEVKVWADGFEPATDPKAEPKPRDKAQPTTLIFGKTEGDSVHVRRILPDGAKADFLVADKVKLGPAGESVDLVSAIKKSRLDLLDPSLKSFSPEIANTIAVKGAANYQLNKDDKDSATGERWTFVAPADKKGQTADTETVAEMLRLLGTTKSATKLVNEVPDEAALIGYGLAAAKTPPKDAPPAPRLKVTIGLKDAPVDDHERIYEFGNPTADPGFVYARQVGKTAVFTVPRLVYDKFATPDLRDRHIFHFDVAKVTGVEFKGWGKAGFVAEFHFVKNKDGAWVIQSPPTPASYMLDPAKLTAFLDLLSKTQVKSFVPGQALPEHGFGNEKEYLQITLKGAGGPLLVLTLGSLTPDGQAYYGWTTSLPQTAPLYTVEAAPLKKYKESSGAFAR